jgi:hypothetical protein
MGEALPRAVAYLLQRVTSTDYLVFWPNNAIRSRFRWLPTRNPKGIFILNYEFSTEENIRPAHATVFCGASIRKQFGWVGRSPSVYA